MIAIPKIIVVPEDLISGIKDGSIVINGLAKNAYNNRVIKHLETFDPTSKLTNKAVKILCFIVAVYVSVKGFKVVRKFRVQGKVKKFKEALNRYIKAAETQKLTVEIIDSLIKALDELKKAKKTVSIDFSSEELSALVDCLCDQTQTLAYSKNIGLKLETTEEEKKDIFILLKNNLIRQRDLFVSVA